MFIQEVSFSVLTLGTLACAFAFAWPRRLDRAERRCPSLRTGPRTTGARTVKAQRHDTKHE